MEIIYNLSEDEVKDVVLGVRFIADRQFDPKENLEWVMAETSPVSRWDMFWVSCHYNGIKLGDLCVDPDLVIPEDFTISRGWNQVQHGSSSLRYKAAEFFKTTPQYQKQVLQMKMLHITFDRFGGVDKFFDECARLRKQHHVHKLEVIARWKEHFAGYLAGEVRRESLDNILKAENVYRISAGMHSGFDHMVCMYTQAYPKQV